MKLSYRLINDRRFIDTLEGLAGQRLGGEAAYKIKKWMDEISKIVNQAKPVYKAMADKYALKDEQGNFQPDDVTGIKIQDDKKEEYAKEFEAFLSTEVEVARAPLHVSELRHASLAPSEIEILEPILTEVTLVS